MRATSTACRLPTQFGAHIDGLHIRPDPSDALSLMGPGVAMPIAAELIDLATRESEQAAKKARSIFDAAIAHHAIPVREKPTEAAASAAAVSAGWREEMGHAPEIVARRARVFDLTVLGQSGRVSDKTYTDTVEETLLHGGHPVLLAPMRPIVPIGEVIAVAWNGSVEAARAVAAAMPFLAKAREVHILTAKDAAEPPFDADFSDYLAWHGIRGISHIVCPVEGVGTGELVLEAARDQGADLLVMGGYGRAPWREMIFGGTTNQVVGMSRLPLLLAH